MVTTKARNKLKKKNENNLPFTSPISYIPKLVFGIYKKR